MGLTASRNAPAADAVSNALDTAVETATAALLRLQRQDGHWAFELEADVTIPAEYILLQHYLDEIDEGEQHALAQYIRSIQGDHGGWPLFHGGDLDVSATVKAYFALKAVGDAADAPHMRRAREAVVARGGAARVNVFTRIQLALFGQMDWRHVPVMPGRWLQTNATPRKRALGVVSLSVLSTRAPAYCASLT